jgi:cell division protein FtsQ
MNAAAVFEQAMDAAEARQLDWKRGLAAAAGVLLGLAIIVALVAALRWAAERPILRIDFKGDVERVDRAELDRFARALGGGVGSIDLAEVRQQLRGLPWVRDASVRRKYPDALEITLEAHRPLARWGETHLINTHGERFAAVSESDLPRFYGADGSEAAMALTWDMLQRFLTGPDLTPRELRLTPRRGWQVRLASGTWLDLGKADLEARLARYVGVVASMPELARAERVDLRHGHGFAVRHRAAAVMKEQTTQ